MMAHVGSKMVSWSTEVVGMSSCTGVRRFADFVRLGRTGCVRARRGRRLAAAQAVCCALHGAVVRILLHLLFVVRIDHVGEHARQRKNAAPGRQNIGEQAQPIGRPAGGLGVAVREAGQARPRRPCACR